MNPTRVIHRNMILDGIMATFIAVVILSLFITVMQAVERVQEESQSLSEPLNQWKQYVKNRPRRATKMEVTVVNSDAFFPPYDGLQERYYAFQIYVADGPTLTGYMPRGTYGAEALKRLVRDKKEHKVTLELTAEGPDGEYLGDGNVAVLISHYEEKKDE